MFGDDDISPIGGGGVSVGTGHASSGSLCCDEQTPEDQARPQRRKTNVSDEIERAELTPPAPCTQSMEEMKLWRHTLVITNALIKNRLVRATSLQEVRLNLSDNCMYSNFTRISCQLHISFSSPIFQCHQGIEVNASKALMSMPPRH